MSWGFQAVEDGLEAELEALLAGPNGIPFNQTRPVGARELFGADRSRSRAKPL